MSTTTPGAREPKLAADEEELGPEVPLPEVSFDEGPATMDDAEASELVLDVRFEDAVVLGDDEDGPLGPLHEALDDDVVRAGSWLEREADALESPVALPSLEASASVADGDEEGPDEAVSPLGEPPPLDARVEDDAADGLVDAALSGLPPALAAFALAPPRECAFVSLSERDADALVSARADAVRTDDGAEVGPSLAARSRGRGPVAAVRSGDLLAYAFARGAGKVSRDGGERFEDAPWLEGATALCAAGALLFAAVFDAPVDRCTIVRAGPDGVERVADLDALVRAAAGADEDEPCEARALVALDADGARLLVRTARRSLVISTR